MGLNMVDYEWPASDYAIGNFIQATVADQYLRHLTTKSDHHILDIGCGDGSYSTKIIGRIPDGTLLGIDRSENMLRLAREKIAYSQNMSVRRSDVLTMDFNEQFDYIVSFWCLQWCTDLAKAYLNIYRALKEGGKVFTIIPAGDDPLLTSFQSVKASGKFPRLNHFKFPVDFKKVAELPNIIAKLPFKHALVETQKHSILLPSLDVFHKFVNGLAFFHGQIPDGEINALNDALVKAYDLECQEKHQGKYRFNLAVYVVTAEK
jgi:ubiquinone/menaquinone biosynthesis C-methylase UbiE